MIMVLSLPFISKVDCDFVNFPKASKPSVQVLLGASVFYSANIDDPTILLQTSKNRTRNFWWIRRKQEKLLTGHNLVLAICIAKKNMDEKLSSVCIIICANKNKNA